ncbi:MAG: 50S ribosomal protein L16 [Berkelbacteria bacterium GW2011_GWB1_38_5]|uniref:Large ribosomal subunit protein uL16 n=2 Tax=Candidatus Berkelbacteria TaxID=1618330 RepID=A0A0G0LSL4_9BACT|nr:MAG: 50S ribosomal protein L16 [Berkelbacteria bacterium GW2011_GWB1_38_5]KKQ90970.1 MAG: 50S ribosomal protein L16 [Berkelbacteria bacterium GW2011_GWA1_39_10]
MLVPRKLKHRKICRGKMRGVTARGSVLSFGSFGIKSLGRAWVSARQIEAARRAITHYIKRGGKVWVRIFPDKPITKTAAESGMGGGKGSLDHFVAVVLPGRIIFEMDGVSEEIAREALRLGAHKLSVPSRFITRKK